LPGHTLNSLPPCGGGQGWGVTRLFAMNGAGGSPGYRRREAGMTTVEFALVALAFFMLLFGIVDMARIAWEFNSAAKAAQWGARFAAVNSPPGTGLCGWNSLSAAGGNGRPVPGAGSTLIAPAPIVAAVSTEMQRIYARALPANVLITYRHAGLGFTGNPLGGPHAVALVTVQLQNLQFVPVTPGLTFASFNLPKFATTMVGENVPC
jgi:TadE-like protein